MAVKYIVNKLATCHECRFEYVGRFAEREANKHADDTGHIPTLEVCYDVAPQNAKQPRPNQESAANTSDQTTADNDLAPADAG